MTDLAFLFLLIAVISGFIALFIHTIDTDSFRSYIKRERWYRRLKDYERIANLFFIGSITIFLMIAIMLILQV